MKTTITSLCIALALTLGASSPALADRGHRDHDRYYGNRHDYGPPRHYQQHREYRRSWVGPAAVLAIAGIAAGVAASTWYAPPAQRVYVAPPAPGYPAPAADYWHYCASAGQYYPNVRYCQEGWQPVYP